MLAKRGCDIPNGGNCEHQKWQSSQSAEYSDMMGDGGLSKADLTSLISDIGSK